MLSLRLKRSINRLYLLFVYLVHVLTPLMQGKMSGVYGCTLSVTLRIM